MSMIDVIKAGLNEKSADIKVITEDGKFHFAFFEEGEVLVIEYIPQNWPSLFVKVMNVEDYFDIVKDVDWLNLDLEEIKKVVG